jgi:hypothetical protein
MHIPKAGERVFVNELEAIYTVAFVNHQTRTADLIPIDSGPIEQDVPWRKLFGCWSRHADGVYAIH